MFFIFIHRALVIQNKSLQKYALIIITCSLSMACQNYNASLYDQKTKQKPVYSHTQIDQIFNSFAQVSYYQLDKKYIQTTGLNNSIYYQRSFYIIKGEDIYKYLVGKFRVLDFIPKDEYYAQNLQKIKNGGINQYLLLDKRVIHKFLDLMEALEKKKLNKDAFAMNDGYRHPVYNKKVGGAAGSLHTWGMAIDIEVGDVDKNGWINKADKKIVLDLLENQIIGTQGGVGRYPWSQTVHFDVRGWYARWDRQN